MKKKPSKANSGELLTAIRSFIGYLEGTEKSEHTVKNYRLDLLTFQDFLVSATPSRSRSKPLARTPNLHQIRPNDIERYQEHLKALGLKTNTRRRKLLTLGRFLKFTAQRGKLLESLGRKVPAPQKVERVPFTLPWEELLAAIRKLPATSVIEARNRALLWTLAESGCLVSEATRLRFSDFSGTKLKIPGRAARAIPISVELVAEVDTVRARAGKAPDSPAFVGHNRYGSLGGAISARGIELLVRSHAERLGAPEMTPRTFRHSVVAHWLKEGKSRTEIRDLLGLKTEYAFRVFEPILAARSSSGTTSTS
ncbi:MAG TPA: site-specific integrase [Bdellovibrionota bacterium]|nr:site-specific integrase [Bdellovibrionota bacterium]